MHQDKIELAVKEAESHMVKFRGQANHAEAIELLDELRKNSRVFKSFLTNVVVSVSMAASFGKPPKEFFLSIMKIMALSDLEFKQEWREHHAYYNYSSVHSMLESCGASGKVLQLASEVDRGVGQIQKQIATIVQTPDFSINQLRMQEKHNTVVRLFDGLKADKSQLKSFMEKVVDKVRLELGTDSEFERLFTPILEALCIVVLPFKDGDKIFHHRSLTSILCCIGASVELVELAVDIDRAGSSVQNIFCLPDSEVEMLGYERYEIKTSRPTDYLALTGNLEVLKWLSGKIEPALYHSVAASRGLDLLNTLIFSKVVLREPFSTALMTLLADQSGSVDRQYFHSFNITKAAVLSGDMNVLKFVQKTFDPWLEGLLDIFPQAYLSFSGINYHEFEEYITGTVRAQKIEITRFDPGYLFSMHHSWIGLGEGLFQFCQQGLTPTECALFESLIGGHGATPEQLIACFDEPEETDIHVLLSNGEILAEQGQGPQELLASQNEQVEQTRQLRLAKWRQKCTIETFSKLLVVDSFAVIQHLNQWALEHNCGSGEGQEITDSVTETGFIAALQKYLLTEMFESPDFNRSPRILAVKSNDNALKSVASLLIKQESSLSHRFKEQGGRLFKLAPAELLSFRDLLIGADSEHAPEALMSLVNRQNIDLLSMHYVRNLINHVEVNAPSLS